MERIEEGIGSLGVVEVLRRLVGIDLDRQGIVGIEFGQQDIVGKGPPVDSGKESPSVVSSLPSPELCWR